MEEAMANHVFQSKEKEAVDETLLWLPRLSSTWAKLEDPEVVKGITTNADQLLKRCNSILVIWK